MSDAAYFVVASPIYLVVAIVIGYAYFMTISGHLFANHVY